MTDDPRYQRILKILELARVARGWSRGRLEEALGRGKSYLKRVATGPSELRVTDLLRAIDVLELAPEEIFGPLVLGTEPVPAGRSAPPPGPPARAEAAAADASTLREIEALVERLVEERLREAFFEAAYSVLDEDPSSSKG